VVDAALPCVAVTGERVYIHELIDIRGTGRARYMHHMTANWGPIGRAERDQLCAGVWATIGSTGRWPQVVNLWEYRSWAALGANFETELVGDGLQDPSLTDWWAVAAELRRGGEDRLLVAAEFSPSIDILMAATGDVPRAGYSHEIVPCRPGAAPALLEEVGGSGLDVHRAAGRSLVGAYRRALCDDDEVVLIWSFESWGAWASAEADGTVREWRAAQRDLTLGWHGTLLADAPLSPLRTGRQPQPEDRRPLDEV